MTVLVDTIYALPDTWLGPTIWLKEYILKIMVALRTISS